MLTTSASKRTRRVSMSTGDLPVLAFRTFVLRDLHRRWIIDGDALGSEPARVSEESEKLKRAHGSICEKKLIRQKPSGVTDILDKRETSQQVDFIQSMRNIEGICSAGHVDLEMMSDCRCSDA